MSTAPAGPALGYGYTVAPVELFRPNPRNPRRELGDLVELTASIKAHGVLQALVAELDVAGDPDRPLVLRAGHRRLAAARKAGLDAVPVEIVEAPDPGDNDAAGREIVAMLAENLHRADLSPVEESDAYEQLRLLDWTPKRIAGELGRRKSTIDRRLALRKLPPAVRERVHVGQIAIADAEALVEFAGDVDQVEKLVADLGTPNFRYAVETARRRRERARETAAAVREARSTGLAVHREKTGSWQYRHSYGDGVPTPLHALAGQPVRVDHAECPGRALVVWDGDTQSAEACLEPSRHGLFGHHELAPPASGDATAAAAVDPEAEARAAEAAARAQLVEDLTAADQARRAWISERLLAPSTRPRRDEQAIMLRQALLADIDERGGLLEVFAEHPELGITPPDTSIEGAEVWADELELTLRAAPVERICQLLWGLLVLPTAPILSQPYGWSGTNGAAFVEGLRELGYQPCAVEQRMLDDVRARD